MALGLDSAFNVWHAVPALQRPEIKEVLSAMGTFADGTEADKAIDVLERHVRPPLAVPIKKLLMLLELAKYGPEG